MCSSIATCPDLRQLNVFQVEAIRHYRDKLCYLKPIFVKAVGFRATQYRNSELYGTAMIIYRHYIQMMQDEPLLQFHQLRPTEFEFEEIERCVKEGCWGMQGRRGGFPFPHTKPAGWPAAFQGAPLVYLLISDPYL